jgi:hypothetical protein
MENGHDADAAAHARPHATSVALALDHLTSAAEDFAAWSVVAEAVFRQVEDGLSPSIDSDETELLGGLRETLYWQRQRMVDALDVAHRARGVDENCRRCPAREGDDV